MLTSYLRSLPLFPEDLRPELRDEPPVKSLKKSSNMSENEEVSNPLKPPPPPPLSNAACPTDHS